MRITFRVAAALVAAAVFSATQPMPVHADIVYTWHETDTQHVVGSMDVLSSALTAGAITTPDIVSLSYIVNGTTYFNGEQLSGTISIPISTTTGAFTASALTLHREVSGETLNVPVDAASMTGASWIITPSGASGTGFWTVSLSSVPEPSTLVMASIAAMVGLCCGVRKRRKPAAV